MLTAMHMGEMAHLPTHQLTESTEGSQSHGIPLHSWVGLHFEVLWDQLWATLLKL